MLKRVRLPLRSACRSVTARARRTRPPRPSRIPEHAWYASIAWQAAEKAWADSRTDASCSFRARARATPSSSRSSPRRSVGSRRGWHRSWKPRRTASSRRAPTSARVEAASGSTWPTRHSSKRRRGSSLTRSSASAACRPRESSGSVSPRRRPTDTETRSNSFLPPVRDSNSASTASGAMRSSRSNVASFFPRRKRRLRRDCPVL